MKSFALLPLICLLAACTTPQTTVTDNLWNDGWQFMRIADTLQDNDLSPADTDYADAAWEQVTLPHTAHLEPYVIEGTQWQGICWYRKQLPIDAADTAKRIVLMFDGAMNNAQVWLNGELLATHKGGFLPVVADLTGRVKPGNNSIAVRLDSYDDPLTGPRNLAQLDFNTYGGLYRNARLSIGDRLHFTDPILQDDASCGLRITTDLADPQHAAVNIQAQIRNARPEAANLQIRHRLSLGGEIVAEATGELHPLDPAGTLTEKAVLHVDAPRLWSPASPALYDLESEIVCDGKVVDARRTKVGIRTVEFRGRDLYVNGQKSFLRGINRHQDYPHVGYAAPDNTQRRDAKLIKEAGFDYVRLSHYPPAPAFLDACDSLGLFVLDAIPGWQYTNPDPRFGDQIEQTVRDMIRRDRNHPCVLAWEVSLNETPMTHEFIDRLCRASREEDSSRPTAGWMEYGYDIFLEARQHRLEFPTATEKPLNVSEYGDWEYYALNAGFNQDAWGDLKAEERTSRQLLEGGEQRMLQQAANLEEAHNDNLRLPAFADGYWVMFDYNRGYAPDLETSGVMSYDRLPKFSRDLFRSQRPAAESGPMVAIASYWDAESSPEVRVFSNCEQVELFVNDRSLGKQAPERGRTSDRLNCPPFRFTTGGFEPGALRAVGYIGGKPVAEQTVRTPGAAAGLRLEIADEGIPAGRNDLLFVRAHVVDANGTIVHNAPGEVTFTLQEGSGAELSGDNPAPLRAGTASILLRTPNRGTSIRLTASSGPFQASGTLNIRP